MARRYYQLVGVEAAEQMQGLMILAFHRTSRLPGQVDQMIVYVDYLATAPWNLVNLCPEPRLRAVGQTLIAGAVFTSQAQGWGGRIGLHALPQAETFYTRCGMTDLGVDDAYEGLRYYEMTSAQAADFVARR